MEIRILSVGKIKEKYLNDAIDEYSKRLGRYCKVSFCRVADEKTPDGCPEAENRRIRKTEGERLLRAVREQDYVIALAIEGENPDSEEMARQLSNLAAHGKSSLVFVIGGSLGLSEEVLSRADWLLSFSRMTFPHQLMQVILLEQIYRSFRIIHHEPYHK